MRISRLTIVLTVLACALLLSVRGLRSISAAKEQTRVAAARLQVVNAKIESARQELATAREIAKTGRAARNKSVSLLSAEKASGAKNDAESAWAEPPARLPLWDAESPYVWISK